MAVPWVKQARSLGITARHSLGLSCIPALGRTPSTRTRVPAIERNKGNQWAGEVSSRPSERRKCCQSVEQHTVGQSLSALSKSVSADLIRKVRSRFSY